MIKIYVTGVLKKDVRINTEELNFLKIKNSFSLECVIAGSQKISCHIGFLKLNILIVPNFLAKNTVNTCHFQGTQETEANCLLIFFGGNNSRNHHRQFQGSRESGFRRRGRYGFYGDSR